MKRMLVLLVLASLSACKKAETEPATLLPTKEVVGGVRMIEYFPPKKSFTCLAPANWGVQETNNANETDTVSFEGGNGYILIVKNPDTLNKTAEAYANSFWEVDPNGKQPTVEKTIIDGKTVYRLNRTQPVRKLHSTQIKYVKREDHAFIQGADAYYQIIHSAPVDSYQATLPIFEAVVRSFKPGS